MISISLNFKANKNGLDESEYVNPFVRIIVDGKETKVVGVEQNGEYVFDIVAKKRGKLHSAI